VVLAAGLTAAVAGAALADGPPGGAHGPHDRHHQRPLPTDVVDFAADPYPSTYRPLPRADTLIAHATVLDGAGHRLDDTDVLLRDGKVAEVGRGLAPPAGAVVIEARGRWVTPGIVDIHSHDGDFASPYTSADLKHSDVNEDSEPNVANVWAEHSITVQDPSFALALAGGVTTLQVLPGSSTLFGGRSVVLHNVPAVTMQAMKFPGARQGLKMACGENPKHTFGDHDEFPVSRMGVVAGARQAWIQADQYRKAWEDYRTGKEDDRPERDLKLDTLAAALNGDIDVHIHCYRADEMAIMLDMAKEFGFRIAAFHHAVEAYKIPDLLAKNGVCAVVWSDWWGYKMEAYDAIRENAAFTDAGGACVTLHSDSPVIGQRLTVEAGKAMSAGNHAGVPVTPEHAIAWVTSNPARVLGLGDRIGSLEPGKDADAVIWSGDPFSIYSKADQVFIDGALVFDRKDPSRRPRSDFEVGQPVREQPR
jgi:imidazolonepropionase-like amidohydrolase